MAKIADLDFSGGITITPISPTNKTHLVVNIEGASIVFHLESWDATLHVEAIRRFDQMANELRAAHSTPTSSCS